MANELLLAECGTLTSVDLAGTAVRRLRGEPMALMTERWQRVEALDGATRALSQAGQSLYRDAQESRLAALSASRHGNLVEANRHAIDSERALRAAVDSTTRVLQHDERQLATLMSVRALTELGYSVKRADGRRSVGLWAERDHHVIAILVQDGGAMEIDNAGVSGGGCAAPMQELQEALARLGAQAEVVRRVDHGDDRGGHLIQRACRADVENPEQGLVSQFEVGFAAPKESTSTTETSRRVIASES